MVFFFFLFCSWVPPTIDELNDADISVETAADSITPVEWVNKANRFLAKEVRQRPVNLCLHSR
jgi:hypothetical protein